jgi:thioredoxin reductase (NADPH)
MEKDIKDAAIIGMGPAGVAAAIYLARSNVNPICFEPGKIGGKLYQVREIENYPAYLGTGEGLAKNMEKQIEHFDLDIRKERVININPNDDGTYLVVTDKQEYLFKSVIIANGMKEKEYAVKGSEKYNSIGISRCAECDAAFHKGQPVAVIGNTNKAYKEAIYLAEIVGKVYLINETGKFDADQELIDDFNKMENTETISGFKIIDSEGSQHIEKLILADVNDENKKREININGLFLFVGATPIYEFIGYMDIVNESGFIQVDEKKSTTNEGLFAIGDCSDTKLRQVVTATGDGAIAAINCVSYLRKLKKSK